MSSVPALSGLYKEVFALNHEHELLGKRTVMVHMKRERDIKPSRNRGRLSLCTLRPLVTCAIFAFWSIHYTVCAIMYGGIRAFSLFGTILTSIYF